MPELIPPVDEIKTWKRSVVAAYWKSTLDELLQTAMFNYRRATKDDFEKLQGALDAIEKVVVLYNDLEAISRDRRSKEIGHAS